LQKLQYFKSDKKSTGTVIKANTTQSRIRNIVVLVLPPADRGTSGCFAAFSGKCGRSFFDSTAHARRIHKSLAERLDSMCNVKVKEAEDDEIIENSHVYIAPGDFHMLLEKNGNDTFK